MTRNTEVSMTGEEFLLRSELFGYPIDNAKRLVKELLRHGVNIRLRRVVPVSPPATLSTGSKAPGLQPKETSKSVSNHSLQRKATARYPLIRSTANKSSSYFSRNDTLSWKKEFINQGMPISSMHWVADLDLITLDSNGGKVNLHLGVVYRIGLTTWPSDYGQGIVFIESSDYVNLKKLVNRLVLFNKLRDWFAKSGLQDPQMVALTGNSYQMLPL